MQHLSADIFLITWPGDYAWLPHLFKSITKYVTGFSRVVIVLEIGDAPPTEALEKYATFPYVIKRCPGYRGTCYNGRSGQSLEKLRAFAYTDADRIVMTDSDCIFVRPIDLQTDELINLAKPCIWSIPWDELPPYHYTLPSGEQGVDYATKWRPPVSKILGFDPPAETMQRFPFVFPGWFLRCLWEHIGGEERLLTIPETCDFNTMGNFALAKFPDFFTQRPALNSPLPAAMKNFWSFTGADHSSVREILKEHGLLEDDNAKAPDVL